MSLFASNRSAAIAGAVYDLLMRTVFQVLEQNILEFSHRLSVDLQHARHLECLGRVCDVRIRWIIRAKAAVAEQDSLPVVGHDLLSEKERISRT